MNFQGIKKILVIKLRHIGDVLLTVPVFRALRENFPQAHITAIVNSGTEAVLTGNPLINEVIAFDRTIKKIKPVQKYLKELSFLKKIRGKGFDMTVDLTSGDRAAIISFASGAKYRLASDTGKDGFPGKRYFYTHLAKNDSSQHMVLQNLDVVRQFGISTENLNVDIFIPEDARTFVKNVFEKNNIPPLTKGGPREGKVIHVHPTSRWLFKCWKDEYMAEVISWLLNMGIKVVVTSSSDKREIEKTKKILSLVSYQSPQATRRGEPSAISHQLIDLCGKTTIKQLAAISEASGLFLGVDSAPMHIAAAVGTPVIALFGPSGAFHWGPWDNKISNFKFQISNSGNPYPERNGIQTFGIHTVIQKNRECIPCGEDGCDGSKISRCLEDITPDDIKNILTKKLRELQR
ncbi:MAG: putative lipopolysaccharide heptosyltransferase III [Thermodesulfovibrionales bacterium]